LLIWQNGFSQIGADQIFYDENLAQRIVVVLFIFSCEADLKGMR
jgi:hypothetical protein